MVAEGGETVRRIWIGVLVLIGLLAASLGTKEYLTALHEPTAEKLHTAAREDRWENAAALSEEAAQQWSQNRHFTAALAEHEEMDRIDGLFHQLEVFRDRRDAISHGAICAQLSTAIQSLIEAHRLTWWNLL